jgi:hypothetical protein
MGLLMTERQRLPDRRASQTFAALDLIAGAAP